ncbi:MAG TPA: hypothetical protein VMN77_04125 [Nitrospiria bacterium]|jgi:hypothetical protein|nr:hypothetical protein [Nitrospiria bacterium]
MTELDEAKEKFIEMIKAVDPQVTVVIPTSSSNSLFLISLSKGKARKFITVSEDDLVDFVSDDLIHDEVEDRVREAISELKP